MHPTRSRKDGFSCFTSSFGGLYLICYALFRFTDWKYRTNKGALCDENKKKYPLIIGLILFGVIGQTAFISTASAQVAQIALEDQRYGSFSENRAETERKHIAMVETQGLDTVLDVLLRLGDLWQRLSVRGFYRNKPFTGLMIALHPHNAIEKAADFLVVRPGNYTFVRPSGSFNYDARSDEEK